MILIVDFAIQLYPILHISNQILPDVPFFPKTLSNLILFFIVSNWLKHKSHTIIHDVQKKYTNLVVVYQVKEYNLIIFKSIGLWITNPILLYFILTFIYIFNSNFHFNYSGILFITNFHLNWRKRWLFYFTKRSILGDGCCAICF